MTSVSLVTANTPLTTTPVTTPVSVSEDKSATSLANSPASVVMLGLDAKVTDATTYSNRGNLANPDPVFTREQNSRNALTAAMTGNMSTKSTAGRFQGLGAALLEQLASDGASSISQSIIKSAASDVKEGAALKAAQAQLHGKAENTITLTLKTTSGATITLNLSSQDDGLAVQADVTGGELSDLERKALASLADSFQGAIDGLTAKTPRLNLGSLAQLDSSLFTSVEMSARLKVGQDQYQTLSFQADEKTKSVNMSGPTGNVELSVKNNDAILGNAQQQAEAVQSYLEQFDAAQSRGEGDKDLMALFKDAFTSLQGNTKGLSGNSGSGLNSVDRSMLTGLADFSASLTQTSQYINPMRPGEVDKFAYKATQSTEVKGTSNANRSVEQKQTSSLDAAYHKSLYPAASLALSLDSKSQNYSYSLIKDEAASTTRIGYDKGALIEASSTQSASQSTTVLKYELGKLVDTISTPKEVSKSRNLLGMIDDAVRRDRNARTTTGKSTLEEDLMSVHAKVLLQSRPSSISN
jgi:hypothetical protein